MTGSFVESMGAVVGVGVSTIAVGAGVGAGAAVGGNVGDDVGASVHSVTEMLKML